MQWSDNFKWIPINTRRVRKKSSDVVFVVLDANFSSSLFPRTRIFAGGSRAQHSDSRHMKIKRKNISLKEQQKKSSRSSCFPSPFSLVLNSAIQTQTVEEEVLLRTNHAPTILINPTDESRAHKTLCNRRGFFIVFHRSPRTNSNGQRPRRAREPSAML